MFGSFGAWSHVPHELMTFPESMTFWQRFQNVFYCLWDKYLRLYNNLPRQQVLVDKYFTHLPGRRNTQSFLFQYYSRDFFPGRLPSVEDLTRSVSVILQNSYAPMTTIKPNVPGIIDVGGIHIKPVMPLPDDLKKFLDEASDGVIYFSFGK